MPRAFPEVHAAFGKFRGRVDMQDAAQRQTFAVLLGDYVQARYGDDIRRAKLMNLSISSLVTTPASLAARTPASSACARVRIAGDMPSPIHAPL